LFHFYQLVAIPLKDAAEERIGAIICSVFNETDGKINPAGCLRGCEKLAGAKFQSAFTIPAQKIKSLFPD
jgi:hypothetical protein